MNTKRVAAQLQRARRELDEAAEWLDRIASEVLASETPPAAVELLGSRELADYLGLQPGTIVKYRQRGTLPEPVAVLACGPIWLKQDVERWASQRAA